LNKDKDKKTQSTEEAEENEYENEDIRIKLHPPTCSDIKRAIKERKSSKAPGMDNICPEMLKLDIETTVNLLHPLLTEIWKEVKFPTDWKEGLIIKIPKKKGDITKCNNWRGITLLSIPSKLLSKLLLNRIKNVVELRS
jgi:hypothetical protein